MLWAAEELGLSKVPNWRYYPRDIRLRGMTDNYSSGPTERFNKDIKKAARYTSFNRHTLSQQVSLVTLGQTALVCRLSAGACLECTARDQSACGCICLGTSIRLISLSYLSQWSDPSKEEGTGGSIKLTSFWQLQVTNRLHLQEAVTAQAAATQRDVGHLRVAEERLVYKLLI